MPEKDAITEAPQCFVQTTPTRLQRFLTEMEKVAPRPRPLAASELYEALGPPRGLERMQRIYFLQHRYGPSDESPQGAQYDNIEMREFSGIDLADEAVPDAPTLLKVVGCS